MHTIKNIILTILLVAMVTVTARAKQPNVNDVLLFNQSCPEQLNDCEGVLEGASLYIKAQDAKLRTMDRKIQLMNEERALLQDQISQMETPWYERPGFVAPAAFIIGFLVNKGIGTLR